MKHYNQVSTHKAQMQAESHIHLEVRQEKCKFHRKTNIFKSMQSHALFQ